MAAQPNRLAGRRYELGAEAVRWHLEGLGAYVPVGYRELALQVLADLADELKCQNLRERSRS